ncbi:MAG: NAD(P)/FAD-dependent oxidoreductase [Lentisphaerae bacterium]|nr:NAD(P)/FAD-dependent oxidoreductase [Lentisphaerota bacterium]
MEEYEKLKVSQVIIIGAGPAGLTAGYKLLKSAPAGEYAVTILEASGTVGGISRTVNHNGNRMDIGGHRFFSKDEEVNRMWEELMPEQGSPSLDDRILQREVKYEPGGPDPEQTDRVMLLRKRVSRIYYRETFFDYPVKISFNTIRNMGLVCTMAAGFSYLKSVFFKRPEDSLENFYINRFGKKLYSMFFESYTEKLWGRHPRNISPDWGAQRVKGLSIYAVLKDIVMKMLPQKENRQDRVETSLIDRFHYPKYGPGQLWEITASEFEKMGGKIIYHAQAEKINLAGGRVRSITYIENGKETEMPCDLLISSMPLKDLAAGMNEIPADAAEAAAGLPYRDFVTVGLLTDRLKLKNKTRLKTLNDLVPDCWIYVQDAKVKLGRIQIFNNWSPYLVKDPEHTAWIGLEYFCQEGDDFWKLSPEELCQRGVSELIKMKIIDPESPILDYHVEKVPKAYPAYFDTYADIRKLIDYLDTIGNLYCIGRNGQHRYNNMDHSMLTAFAAVEHILSGKDSDRSKIWTVNTEKEYHEEQRSQSGH